MLNRENNINTKEISKEEFNAEMALKKASLIKPEMGKIRIKEDYIEDETINGFYNQLQLVHQTRRLDYLLINMQGLHKKLEGTVQGGRLAEAILTMQRKRNKFVENECVM